LGCNAWGRRNRRLRCHDRLKLVTRGYASFDYRLEKQKEGRKRMRQPGKVEISQCAFIAALKMGDG
jgi:translation elongation factor EF-4